MASRKKARTAKKSAKKKVARRAKPNARKPAAKTASLDALARKIVRATNLTEFPLHDLYTEDAISEEATGDVARGIAGLEEKLKRWEQMQAGTKWTARNVWTGPKTICIEWDAEVNLRDGRTVKLREIGVHEIRNGKISIERFYYNPMQLQPPA
jgi:ketosteroid isomerase-like protein